MLQHIGQLGYSNKYEQTKAVRHRHLALKYDYKLMCENKNDLFKHRHTSMSMIQAISFLIPYSLGKSN